MIKSGNLQPTSTYYHLAQHKTYQFRWLTNMGLKKPLNFYFWRPTVFLIGSGALRKLPPILASSWRTTH